LPGNRCKVSIDEVITESMTESHPNLLKRFEKPLFWSAALFNYAFGLWIIDIDRFVAFFAGPEMLLNDPLSRFFAHASLLAILLFGIGYNMVALWPDRHRGIAFLGMLGKVGIAPIIWVCYLDGGVGLASNSNFGF
jgi:hypothetical protein